MSDVALRVRALFLALAFPGFLLGAPGVHAAGAESPVDVVEALHRVLAEHLAPPGRDFADRLERLEPVVARSFDFDTITRVALGPAFEPLDGAARERFTDILRRLSALTYAERFDSSDSGSGARFVTVSQAPARRGATLVRTRLERESGAPVALDYVLGDTDRGPRIVNVLADGVSDLSLKRSEYAAVIRSDGVAGLERQLRAQLDELAARGAGS